MFVLIQLFELSTAVLRSTNLVAASPTNRSSSAPDDGLDSVWLREHTSKPVARKKDATDANQDSSESGDSDVDEAHRNWELLTDIHGLDKLAEHT